MRIHLNTKAKATLLASTVKEFTRCICILEKERPRDGTTPLISYSYVKDNQTHYDQIDKAWLMPFTLPRFKLK